MAIVCFSVFLAALAASIAALFFFLTKLRQKKSSNLPPGSFGWPLVGETIEYLQMVGNIMDDTFIRSRMAKYDNRVFKTSLFGNRVAFLCGTAGNKFLFSNENKLFVFWMPKWVRRLVGQSMMNQFGDEAKRTRRMLMTFLEHEALQRYIATVDMVTQNHLETYWEGQKELKAYPLIKKYNFDVACRLFLSVDDPEKVSKLSNLFSRIVKGMLSLPINFPGTSYYQALRASDAIRGEIKEIIKHRRVALANKTASPTQDLVSGLLVHPYENGVFMPEEEIINNTLGLLLAGQDTTSSSIAMLMKYLGELPEVYERVLKEQMDIAMAKEPGQLLNWEDIKKMKYSGNVLSELMRVSMPVAGAIMREAIVDFTYAGYTIPKGWKLMWSTIPHNDPTIFANPKNFDPSRFEGDGPQPFTYNPFGGGPRMCMGKEYAKLEMLVFLHNVIKRFKWQTLCPDEKFQVEIMPIPSQGLPIGLRPHQS